MQNTRYNFQILKKGGYNPIDVEAYIQKQQEELNSLRQRLEKAHRDISANGHQKEEGTHLYDPDNAATKLLGAAQEMADKMIKDAESQAREKVSNFFQEQEAKVETQKALYESTKSDLLEKLTEVQRLKAEMDSEVSELLEQSKFKMSVIAQAINELKDTVDGHGNMAPQFSAGVIQQEEAMSIHAMATPVLDSDTNGGFSRSEAIGDSTSSYIREPINSNEGDPAKDTILNEETVLKEDIVSEEKRVEDRVTVGVPDESMERMNADEEQPVWSQPEPAQEPEPTQIFDPLVQGSGNSGMDGFFQFDGGASSSEDTAADQGLSTEERKWIRDLREAATPTD